MKIGYCYLIIIIDLIDFLRKNLKKYKSNKKKEKDDFFNKVYNVAKKIPYGKVTTYGHIAEACGIKSSARTVGWALNGC